MMGLVPSQEETPGCLAPVSLSAMLRRGKKAAIYKPGPSPGGESAYALILDSLVSRTMRNIVLGPQFMGLFITA